MLAELTNFFKSFLHNQCQNGDERNMMYGTKPKLSSDRNKRMVEIATEVSTNIPKEVAINKVGRSVVMIKGGRLYPVTHSVVTPFVEAAVNLDHPVTIKTDGLSMSQVNMIADTISRNNRAVVEVTPPVRKRADERLIGMIKIKGDK